MQLELKQRVVSAVILGIAVLFLAWFGGLPFRIFCAVLAALIYYEWTAIVQAERRSRPAFLVGWASMGAIMWFIVGNAFAYSTAAILIGAGAVALAARTSGRGPWMGLGVLYAGFSGLALAALRDDTTLGLIGMAFVFAVVWATDILAYFCGRAIGGRKLAPRISPGKTWSGAIFGMFGGIAAGTAVALLTLDRGGIWIPILCAVLSIASQVGDLFESWMKRRYAVKDSGRLIPGHGGVMDRVDGLVFAAFAAFLIALVIAGGIPSSSSGSPIAAALLAG